jgi:hypothetical protein
MQEILKIAKLLKKILSVLKHWYLYLTYYKSSDI